MTVLRNNSPKFITQTTISFVVLVQVLFSLAPLTVNAQTVQPSEPEVICPASGSGISKPTGAAANTYSFNPLTCNWENAYYSWDPVTKVYTPRYNTNFVLNPNTGNMEKTTWVYSPGLNGYRAVVTTQAIQNTGPNSNNEISDSGNNSNDNDASISNTGPDSTNTIDDPVGDTSINNTGPNSNNEANTGSIDTTGPDSNNVIDVDNGDSTADINSYTDISVTQNVAANSLSGDAFAVGNTTAGGAMTGDATTNATILNMVQSAVGMNGVQPNYFTANLQGDYVGDLTIDPGSLASSSSTLNGYDDLVVNAETDASITNNVDLLAQSGNATVSNNTTGGDATTGDANAVANVVNMINSSITSGQSFVGVINVDGDLEGDILYDEDILDELIASNVPTFDLCGTCGSDDLDVNFSNNQTIANNITTEATSGTAVVSGNTTGGDATTGDADTNVTVFNLTGSQVIASNSLLVFVNVAGEWVGFITNAPEGATAAVLASDVEENSNTYSDLPQGENTTYDIDNDFSIENNINVAAQSGDASVIGNTTGGSAMTGDASASVNTSNITNSNFALGNWFGMLFINVSGDWHGSFGTDTPYGGISSLPSVVTGPKPQQATPSPVTSNDSQVRVFEVTSVSANGSQISFSEQTNADTSNDDDQAIAGTSSTLGENVSNAVEAVAETADPGNSTAGIVTTIVLAGAGIAILFNEQLLGLIRRP